MNDLASFELLAVLTFEPRQRPVFRFDKALTEDMIQDVFQVRELVILELELDQLGSGGSIGTRVLVVCQPQLRVGGHDDDIG